MMSKQMKLLTVVAIGAAMTLTGCTCRDVSPGEAGVQYALYGSEAGQLKQVGVGRHALGPGDEMEVFPVFVQNVTFTADKTEQSPSDESITFQDEDGQTINTDLSVQFQIREADVVKVYETYRADNEHLVNGIIRNVLRDAMNETASKMKVQEIYGERKSELRDTVEKVVRARLEPNGIDIKSVNFINSMRLPPAIQAALEAKTKATQEAMRIENELRQTQAAAAKLKAEAEGAAAVVKAKADGDAAAAKARADGDAAAMLAIAKAQKELANSVTPALMEYKKLEIEKIKAERWNGDLPVTIGGGSTQQVLHFTPSDLQTIGQKR